MCLLPVLTIPMIKNFDVVTILGTEKVFLGKFLEVFMGFSELCPLGFKLKYAWLYGKDAKIALVKLIVNN